MTGDGKLAHENGLGITVGNQFYDLSRFRVCGISVSDRTFDQLRSELIEKINSAVREKDERIKKLSGMYQIACEISDTFREEVEALRAEVNRLETEVGKVRGEALEEK